MARRDAATTRAKRDRRPSSTGSAVDELHSTRATGVDGAGGGGGEPRFFCRRSMSANFTDKRSAMNLTTDVQAPSRSFRVIGQARERAFRTADEARERERPTRSVAKDASHGIIPAGGVTFRGLSCRSSQGRWECMMGDEQRALASRRHGERTTDRPGQMNEGSPPTNF
jgi:hypothetical protein